MATKLFNQTPLRQTRKVLKTPLRQQKFRDTLLFRVVFEMHVKVPLRSLGPSPGPSLLFSPAY